MNIVKAEAFANTAGMSRLDSFHFTDSSRTFELKPEVNRSISAQSYRSFCTGPTSLASPLRTPEASIKTKIPKGQCGNDHQIRTITSSEQCTLLEIVTQEQKRTVLYLKTVGCVDTGSEARLDCNIEVP